jgi:hypothetical protein
MLIDTCIMYIIYFILKAYWTPENNAKAGVKKLSEAGVMLYTIN